VSRFLRTPWRSRGGARAIDSTSLATGVALVRALAAFDAETAEHSATVALYARDVALQLGADADAAAAIQLGALVHDVGKLALPAELLLKADPLDEDEWALVREHPEAGARIVGACDAYAAMTQDRPYRAPLDPDEAIAELRRNADAQFDAEVVAALVWLLDAGGPDYRTAREERFSAEAQHAELAERTEVRHAAAS
jgi:HD-GYP domain-containing protein (c-di-GMP phosphodiesterase class II)